jgi:hypothetical protein
MLAIIVGLITAFNFLIIIRKIRMGRSTDAALDVGFIISFTWLFGDTGQLGMVVAMTASAVVSVVLLNTPFDFDDDDNEEEELVNVPTPTLKDLKA